VAFARQFAGRVQYFAMFNEPDMGDSTLVPEQVAEALRQFASGLRSVDPSIRVLNGGLANFENEPKTQAFLRAYAPLFNDGTLYALNLHSYMNEQQVAAPSYNNRTPNANFPLRKSQAGITADVPYANGEWNMRGGVLTEEERAKRIFTLMWDHFGAMGAGGNNNPKTLFAGIYQLWGAAPSNSYVLANNQPRGTEAWSPKLRAQVVQRVLEQTKDAVFTDMSPLSVGRFVLEQPSVKKIWVQQNRTQWNSLGSRPSITVDHIPLEASHLEVWYWDGKSAVLPDPGTSSAIEGLRPEETVMVISRNTPIARLMLTSICSHNPATNRVWRIRNTNAFPVKVDWDVFSTPQQGTLVVGPGDTFFNTTPVPNSPNTTRLSWKTATGIAQQTVKASSGATCTAPPVVSNGTP
jgi:hypothetical protein